jgi:hypothetical protein
LRLPDDGKTVKPTAYNDRMPSLRAYRHEDLSMLFATFLLFAQKGPPPGAKEAAGVATAIVLGSICVGVVVGGIVMTLMILHLVTMYKTLGMIKKRNRTMEPGMVFLALVPMLNVVWHFFIVMRVAESLRNEFEDRGWDTREESFGYGMGLTAAILMVAQCAPIGLIFLIIHWRQIAGYAGQLSGERRKR